MKTLFPFLVLLFTFFSSCKSNGAEEVAENQAEAVSPIEASSAYYGKVVYKHSGDYLGLSLGQSREDVMAAMDGVEIEEETDGYIYYIWKFDNNESYLSLYFDENNKLNYIEGFVYFYKADDNYDKDEARKFYNDLVADFSVKHGEPIETEKYSKLFANWIAEKVEVEVGLDGGQVLWSVYEHVEILE